MFIKQLFLASLISSAIAAQQINLAQECINYAQTADFVSNTQNSATIRALTFIEQYTSGNAMRVNFEQVRNDWQIIMPTTALKCLSQKDKKEGETIGIAGETILSLILAHSALNKTKTDDATTISLLSAALTIGQISPTGTVAIVVFEKGKDGIVRDFISTLSLAEACILWSFPRALELLIKHGVELNKKNCRQLVKNMSTHNPSWKHKKGFLSLLEKHV